MTYSLPGHYSTNSIPCLRLFPIHESTEEPWRIHSQVTTAHTLYQALVCPQSMNQLKNHDVFTPRSLQQHSIPGLSLSPIHESTEEPWRIHSQITTAHTLPQALVCPQPMHQLKNHDIFTPDHYSTHSIPGLRLFPIHESTEEPWRIHPWSLQHTLYTRPSFVPNPGINWRTMTYSLPGHYSTHSIPGLSLFPIQESTEEPWRIHPWSLQHTLYQTLVCSQSMNQLKNHDVFTPDHYNTLYTRPSFVPNPGINWRTMTYSPLITTAHSIPGLSLFPIQESTEEPWRIHPWSLQHTLYQTLVCSQSMNQLKNHDVFTPDHYSTLYTRP